MSSDTNATSEAHAVELPDRERFLTLWTATEARRLRIIGALARNILDRYEPQEIDSELVDRLMNAWPQQRELIGRATQDEQVRHFTSWLVTVLRWVIAKLARAPATSFGSLEHDPALSRSWTVERREASRAFVLAVAGLPAQSRAIVLQRAQGMTFTAIAQDLGGSKDTIRTKLQQVQRLIKHELRGYADCAWLFSNFIHPDSAEKEGDLDALD